MKSKSLVEMIEAVDTTYLTDYEKAAAVARAEASEYAVTMIMSAFSWVKKALVSKRITLNTAKQSHA